MSSETLRSSWFGRMERAAAAAERSWPLLLALCSFVLLAVTIFLDSKRPFWNDELFTFYISRRPTLAGVWAALMTGAEQLPPFFFVVIRGFTSVFGKSTVAFRLPESLGYVAMSVSLFLFVRRRASASYGLVAFFFPAVTDAYSYSYEARPYGLVMGFCGLATLGWQAAAEGRQRALCLPILAVSLACAVSCHYYAVLVLFPFGLAECVRYLETRRLDLPMYAALAASVIPLFLFLPLIRAASRYSSKFWAKPSWTSLITFYEDLLWPSGLALLLIVLAAGALLSFGLASKTRPVPQPKLPARDLALAFGFVLIPIIAIVLAKLVTGAFTSRYAVYAVIGLSVLLAWSLSRLTSGTAIAGLAVVCAMLCCWLVLALRQYQRFAGTASYEAQTYAFLISEGQHLPVVIASPHQFFVQSHRAASLGHPGVFVYLADTESALKYTNTDTVERGLLALKDYARLDVEPYRQFVASHPTFLVYGFPDPFGWIVPDLMRAGHSISVKALNGDSPLYLVQPGIGTNVYGGRGARLP